MLAGLVLALVGRENEAGEAQVTMTQTWSNDLPPRLQWNSNFGYCGETALISAGLYYGQYASQYDVRAIASKGAPQQRASSQLLLGVNDQRTAATMHLNTVEWNTGSNHSPRVFLAWVKRNVKLGYPVAIGVYTNEFRFYGTTKASAGDPQYDHIVPVSGFRSSHPLSNPAYFADDVILFSDNGLWAPGGKPPYAFDYSFGSFPKTRVQANAHMGPIYSLASTAGDYGVAITGVTDPAHDTLPVRLQTNVNYEKPEIVDKTSIRPAPMPLVLTVTLSGLKAGTPYKLYRYSSFSAVPDAAFNAHAAQAAEEWDVQINSGTSYTLTVPIMSDEVAVFRAVRASAK